MANKLAITNGNWLTAGTWVSGNTGTNAVLISTSAGTTALTTGNLDSATFTPAAQASQYLAIRLGSRAAGSPSNKMTVILRNNTTTTNIWTFVINVSSIPVCTTADDNGGWLIFKAASPLTPNGTDTYVVRCLLDSTSTAVSLCTNGTANNWQRQMFQTATSAPVAGDDMLIGGLWDTTNPAVMTSVTVTMNETATTAYGSATTNYRTAALNLGTGGTLTYDVGASRTLRLAGWLLVYSGGTLSIGTAGSPVPRAFTAILEFPAGVDLGYAMAGQIGSTINAVGQSRLAGSSQVWGFLNANASAAATSLTVDRQLSAINGDSVIVASTVQAAPSQNDLVTLNADATSTTLSLSAGITNAHNGGADTGTTVQAEVAVLSRNVIIRATTITFVITVISRGTLYMDWVLIQNSGNNTAATEGLSLATTSCTVSHTVIRDGKGPGLAFNTGCTNAVVSDVICYNNQSTGSAPTIRVPASLSGISMTNVWSFTSRGASSDGIALNFGSMTVANNIRSLGMLGYGFSFGGNGAGLVATDLVTHSCNNGSLFPSGATVSNMSFLRFKTRKNISMNASASWIACVFQDCVFADGTNPLVINGGYSLIFDNCTIANAGGAGVVFTAGPFPDIQFRRCGFGSAAGGTFSDNISALSMTSGLYATVTFINTSFGEAAPTIPAGLMTGSYFAYQAYDGSANVHAVYTPYGVVAYETTTVDVSPSIKLTPSSATVKLDTASMIPFNGFYVPVDNAQTPTVSIKIYVDGSYNGNAPRLILKANAAIGINADTVIATWSGSTGSFVTVSGTTAAATAKGVMEFVVDCDGTAGNVYVDTFTVANAGASALSGLSYWYAGAAC